MGTLKAKRLLGGTFIDAHDARTEIFATIVPPPTHAANTRPWPIKPLSHSNQISPKIIQFFGPYNRCNSSPLGRPFRAPIPFGAEKTQGVALGYPRVPRWGAENRGVARCLG